MSESPVTPAGSYVDGRADIPEGTRLFVEYWEQYEKCAHMFADFPNYFYEDGILKGHVMASEAEPEIGYYGYRLLPIGEYSALSAMRDLPFTSVYPGLPIIHSVEQDGTVVTELDSGFARFAPEQSWSRQFKLDRGDDCVEIITYSFFNHGFLPVDHLQLTVDAQ